jgi:hypothetical protein
VLCLECGLRRYNDGSSNMVVLTMNRTGGVWDHGDRFGWSIEVWGIVGVWWMNCMYSVELATGLGYLPAISVRMIKIVWFSYKHSSKCDPQQCGGPNCDVFIWTHVCCRVWENLSVPISCSGFRDYLFIVIFRYHTAKCTIVTLVHHCCFLMYWPSL